MILETLWRWRVALMATGVGLLAAMMRFLGLGYPTDLVFDEVFYARGAYSLVTLGFEGDWGGDNQDFANGDYSQLSSAGDYVVHPLIGKLLIGVGIEMFGPTPLGWRFMGALLGTVTVVIVALVARHLLHSTLWGAVAGVLLAIDGVHVVLSRAALLDIYLTFFVVGGFALLVVDRSRTRRRLEARADAARAEQGQSPGSLLAGLGPRTGIRWWRLAAIVSLSLSVGVKWSGLWFMAAFLVLSVVVDMVDRREIGVERWFMGAFVRAVPAFLVTVAVLPAVYLASWLPWFRSEESYGRRWAEEHPGEGVTWLPDSLRSLVQYHHQMWDFHRTLDSPHNYESNPFLWLLQWRPTAFHFDDAPDAACGAERCVTAIHAIGHPMIWWAGVIVLLFALWRVVRRGDMLAATLAVGVLAGWVPWLPYAHRTIFGFYTVSIAPFMVLLLVWGLARLAQPSRLHGGWSRTGSLVAGAFVAVALIMAGFFAPIWTGVPIPFEYWQVHMWLPSWV
ncbi:dolichyl-phosphate-mannose--protein mannosyltransferase [Demequina aestuarii]|uniref:dolichyl-phosphate-mannose--protein mannosyltransferase n=1 Tax=Demequina aestuarii TaxID=327095 RepID=UPI0007866E0C|nr:phospholipid carrier-dependent glycosyltransferase [Demequina aestuarii]